jgi:signal transduction histidine kinase
MTKRLLLVDDDHANIAVLLACLEALEVETVTVPSAEEAPFAIEHFHPDLVLASSDLLEAFDLLAHVRAESTLLPFIVIAKKLDREQRLRLLEEGADDYLVMPNDYAVLVARARTRIAQKEEADILRTKHARLATLDARRRELAELAVHDLKNPIAALSANVAWLMEVVTARAEVGEALSDTESATRHLQSMVDDLLTITRIEEARLPIHRAHVEVRPMIDELVRGYHREARDARLSLESCVPPDFTLDADAHVLRRILDNLVDNALRHTPDGGRILVSASDGDPAEVCIANTGAPLSADDRERLLRSLEHPVRGTSAIKAGLGLYFCKLAAEAHGGSIDVDSTAEWPVRFTVRLPSHPTHA